MALQEYADIGIIDGVEAIIKYRVMDTTAHASLPASKKADIRPVTRTDATIDPLTQTLGPEVVTIGESGVTVERAAVSRSNEDRAAVATATAESLVTQHVGDLRELLRLAVQGIRIIATSTNVYNQLSVSEKAEIDALVEIDDYVQGVRSEAAAIAANAAHVPNWPTPPGA